jgi:hypothetical protein
MKIRLVVVELFSADGKTHVEVNNRFSQFFESS